MKNQIKISEKSKIYDFIKNYIVAIQRYNHVSKYNWITFRI